MTNHPNRGPNTYWVRFPRGFANEYTVAVATTAELAEQYADEGYEQIDRSEALRRMSRRAGDGETLSASAERDGQDVNRFELAQALRVRSEAV